MSDMPNEKRGSHLLHAGEDDAHRQRAGDPEGTTHAGVSEGPAADALHRGAATEARPAPTPLGARPSKLNPNLFIWRGMSIEDYLDAFQADAEFKSMLGLIHELTLLEEMTLTAFDTALGR
jgi:hypothetical protein